MNIGSAFPSAYLKAADLQGRSVTVIMARVTMEDISSDHKPVLYFQGKDRGLVLNKTNSNVIAEMHGWETDDWGGKPVTIYPARVEFQGKIVDAIRVKLEAPQQRQAPPAPPAAPPQQPARQAPVVVDDEIPF